MLFQLISNLAELLLDMRNINKLLALNSTKRSEILTLLYQQRALTSLLLNISYQKSHLVTNHENKRMSQI